MQVRNAIVAVTVAVFALTLSACTTDPPPLNPTGPATDPTSTAAPSPTATGDATQPSGEIRDITEGFDLAGTANSLRTGFPSFADKSDEQVEAILNAGCDGIDATGTPIGGANAIADLGIAKADAAFATLAAIQLYCPEYKQFLGGSTTG